MLAVIGTPIVLPQNLDSEEHSIKTTNLQNNCNVSNWYFKLYLKYETVMVYMAYLKILCFPLAS